MKERRGLASARTSDTVCDGPGDMHRLYRDSGRAGVEQRARSATGMRAYILPLVCAPSPPAFIRAVLLALTGCRNCLDRRCGHCDVGTGGVVLLAGPVGRGDGEPGSLIEEESREPCTGMVVDGDQTVTEARRAEQLDRQLRTVPCGLWSACEHANDIHTVLDDCRACTWVLIWATLCIQCPASDDALHARAREILGHAAESSAATNARETAEVSSLQEMDRRGVNVPEIQPWIELIKKLFSVDLRCLGNAREIEDTIQRVSDDMWKKMARAWVREYGHVLLAALEPGVLSETSWTDASAP